MHRFKRKRYQSCYEETEEAITIIIHTIMFSFNLFYQRIAYGSID